ncbi:alkylation response protein AidB-like acyl-CoA dehydrogenase [Bradyrhizobium sp. AZCC 1610]|uniref:acyl-CoA dehydrogenase family protein n=1 Tax=Bradyrhizobium sp. AZCC 1610 TaxID=3117020 RepID=UPI00305BAA58
MNVQEAQFRNFVLESSRVQFRSDCASFRQRAAAVAEAAAAEVEAADREARFPRKAIDGVRKQRLLGHPDPIEFSGDGASISEVTDMCYTLGRACASAGMTFATLQTKVACLVRHGAGSAGTKG